MQGTAGRGTSTSQPRASARPEGLPRLLGRCQRLRPWPPRTGIAGEGLRWQGARSRLAEKTQPCSPRTEEANPTSGGSTGGGSGGQGPQPVAAWDRQGAADPLGDGPQVRTGQEPTRERTNRHRHSLIRYHRQPREWTSSLNSDKGHSPVGEVAFLQFHDARADE